MIGGAMTQTPDPPLADTVAHATALLTELATGCRG
jgi:hypothetical protein